MSGSFESTLWNTCVRRLDLGLYSHPKEFLGEWSQDACKPHEGKKIPSTGKSEEDRTRDPASRRTASPTHCFGPDLDSTPAFPVGLHRLVGPVVKASASRAEGPGFESRLRRDFFGVESYQ